MRVWLGLAVVLGGCGFPKLPAIYDASEDAGDSARTEVARIPVTVNRDLDMLFVIDDSPSMLDKQTNLKNAFPAFVNELNASEGGLPNVHIGVVTTDLGTKGADDATAGPGIGAGPGSCSGTGDNGNLQTNGTTLVSGVFISDTRNTDGSRTTNYTGSLSDAFAAIASVGAGGCGFEQPLQAIKMALNGNTMNTGFLRPSAGLAVIVLADEDDCSMSHSTLLSPDTNTFGPLQSFRCTRFGIKCDIGGTDTTLMNEVGPKSGCYPADDSPYLTRVDDYATFLKGLKSDPSKVLFASMVGPATPFDVELRTPPGGGNAIQALAHSCTYTGATSTEVGDPAVRILHLASQFPRNTSTTVCSQDLSSELVNIARQVRSVVGDACLTKEIAMPADCVVVDEVGTAKTAIPACSGSVTTNCYLLVPDAAKCSTASHLRLEVIRSTLPPPETIVVASCRV